MEDRQSQDRLSRVEIQLEKMAALIHDSFRTMSSALELQGRVVDDRLTRLETIVLGVGESVRGLAESHVELTRRHAELERQMVRNHAETEQTLREMQRAILELARRVPPYPDTNGSGPIN